MYLLVLCDVLIVEAGCARFYVAGRATVDAAILGEERPVQRGHLVTLRSHE